MAFLGIDVSKKTFNCCLDLAGERIEGVFDNDKSGFAKLRAWLRKNKAKDVHACLESTGPYWRDLATYLHAAKLKVSVVNPARSSFFARSQLRRTKTDVVDARMLADFCATQKQELWEPEPAEVLELRGLLTYRSELVKQRIALKQIRESVVVGKELQALNALQIKSILDGIAQIEAMIKSHVARHERLRQGVERLMPIPGIGFQTAAALVAKLPVQRLHGAKAAAAYAGLTPGDRQSGTSVHGKPRMAKTGHAELRRDLYMPALSAMRYEPTLKAFADRLAAKGKAPKQIIVAVMHKLVRLVYALLKNGTTYIPKTA